MSHRNLAANNPNVLRSVAFDNPQPSTTSSRTSSVARAPLPTPRSGSDVAAAIQHPDDFGDWDSDDDEMSDRRPPLHMPTDGLSVQPLLSKDNEADEDRGRRGYSEDTDIEAGSRPHFSRRSTMRSRSPDTQAKLATRKKYTYAAFFLGLSLISFVIQTETAVYIQHELHWDKAYCML
jgi:hypothetical protein